MKNKKLTFDDLRKKNLKRLGEIHNCEEWDYPEWMMATMGELGELANILKKIRRGSKVWNDETREEVRYELADTMIYLDLLANCLNEDLGEAVREKFNLVSKKYNSKVTL